MSTTNPGQTSSAGGAPAGMPARLWEAAKHGARGTIPQWVRAAPDAGATAPPRIGQIARRAAQVAAAAGLVGGGIGVGIGATEVASRPVDLAHSGGGPPGADHTSTGPGGDAPGADHISTDFVTGSPASSDFGDAPGPPGSASEGGVTLHTSGDGGHLATGLETTWRIPGHGAVGGERGQDGAAGGHDGLTVEMYQDVVVNEGADGMFSVNAVEYVVVRDVHDHAYVFRENYHTVVPDPPGQETDLVVHETGRVQVVERPDGSFSVTQADNSIGVMVGSDGDGHNEVTVTQTESVQIGHDPHADGHDTASLTEIEYGATTNDQTEVVSAGVLPPPAQEPGRPAPAEAPGGPPTAGETSGQSDGGAVHGTAGSTTSLTASTAASSQVGTAPSTPLGNLPRGSGDVYTAAAGYQPGRRRDDDGRRTDVGQSRTRQAPSPVCAVCRQSPVAVPLRRGTSRTSRSRRSTRKAGRSTPRPARWPQGRSSIRRRSHRPTRRERTRTTAPRPPTMTSPVSTNPAPTPASIWQRPTQPSPGPAPTPTASVSTKRQAGLTLTPRQARHTRRPGTTPAPIPPSSIDPHTGRKKRFR